MRSLLEYMTTFLILTWIYLMAVSVENLCTSDMLLGIEIELKLCTIDYRKSHDNNLFKVQDK